MMTYSNQSHTPIKPESLPPAARRRGVIGWRRALVMGGILAGGIALGAGGLAVAATMPGPGGWRAGIGLAFIQRVVLTELDSIGATAAQESKVHDIVAATASGLEQAPEQRQLLRKRAFDLLRAPTVDRAAVEKLRAEQVAQLDAMSKKLIASMLDVADQLTPEQRAKLAEHAEARMQHGPGGGGPMGGPWGGNPWSGRVMRP